MDITATYEVADVLYEALCREFMFPELETLWDMDAIKGFLKKNPDFSIILSATPDRIEPTVVSLKDYIAVTFTWSDEGHRLVNIRIEAQDRSLPIILDYVEEGNLFVTKVREE